MLPFTSDYISQDELAVTGSIYVCTFATVQEASTNSHRNKSGLVSSAKKQVNIILD